MNMQIYEEASDWLVEFRTEEVGHAARKRFEKWLSISPVHVRAYLEISSVWEVASAQAPADPQDIDALIERARAGSNVVVAHPASNAESKRAVPVTSRRGVVFALAASVLVAAVGLGTYLYSQRNVYNTAIGEQRSILLSDGSTIDLNARSRVRVVLDEHERHIDLIEGQALFKVAKDARRPFIVVANGASVRAVGTQFDVNQRKRGLIVTVVEGTVAVSPASISPRVDAKSAANQGQQSSDAAPDSTLMLGAGQQVTVSAIASTHAGSRSAPQPHKADVDSATAWTQRRLIFDSTPLDEVAEEFNRNNTRPLVIEGAGLEDFHVSGAFSSSDPEPLLRFLRAQSGIQVVERSDSIVVSRGP